MSFGTFYQILARISFVLSSYGLHIALAYLITDLNDYGRIGVIFSMMSIARVILTTGLPQSATRDIAADQEHAGAIYRTALKLQIGMGLIIFVAYIAGTPVWIRILGDPGLSRLIMISGLIIPFTAAYQIMLAWLNAHRRFAEQSIMLTIYSVARVILAIGLVLAGFGLNGVLWGLLLATIGCWLILLPRIRPPVSEKRISPLTMIGHSLPYILSSVGIIGLLNLDLILLKHFFPDDPLVGYYAGAVNIGKLPYFVLLAYAATMLPTISRAIGMNRMQEAGKYARREMTSLVVILIVSSTLIAASAERVLDFIYPQAFTAAADTLRILFCASCGLALLQTLVSLFGAVGRIKLAAVIVLTCIPIQILLGFLLIPRMGGEGMALANLLAGVLGIGILCFTFRRIFGPFITISTVVCSLPAAGLAYWMVSNMSENLPLWLLPGQLMVGLLAFMIVLLGIDADLRTAVRTKIRHGNLLRMRK